MTLIPNWFRPFLCNFFLSIKAALSSEDVPIVCSTLKTLSGPFDLCVWGREKETNMHWACCIFLAYCEWFYICGFFNHHISLWHGCASGEKMSLWCVKLPTPVSPHWGAARREGGVETGEAWTSGYNDLQSKGHRDLRKKKILLPLGLGEVEWRSG